MYFELAFSLMTFLASFMYHTLEAFEIERFILTEDEWHYVDNVGAALCFS